MSLKSPFDREGRNVYRLAIEHFIMINPSVPYTRYPDMNGFARPFSKPMGKVATPTSHFAATV